MKGYVRRLLLGAVLLGAVTQGVPTSPARAWGNANVAASRSQGLPWEGTLHRAVPLRQSSLVRRLPAYTENDRYWGTFEIVQLIERAALRVAQRFPGARLSVGEISAREGGEIPGHHSHENGRDVDVAFYMVNRHGRPVERRNFVDFRIDGRASNGHPNLFFDDWRNWELITKLVTDSQARVQFIFVSDEIKERLLAVGRAARAPRAIVDRARRVMMQPREGHPHRNHFHVRIYCPPGDRPACQDTAPFHPWYPGTRPTQP